MPAFGPGPKKEPPEKRLSGSTKMSCSSNGGNFIVPQPLCRDLFAFDLDEFIGDRVVELDGLLFDVFVEVGFVSQFRSLTPGRADHVFERVVLVGRYAESMVPLVIWNILVLWLIAVFHDESPRR